MTTPGNQEDSESLRQQLLDAGELHLADESTIYHLEARVKQLTELQAQVAEFLAYAGCESLPKAMGKMDSLGCHARALQDELRALLLRGAPEYAVDLVRGEMVKGIRIWLSEGQADALLAVMEGTP